MPPRDTLHTRAQGTLQPEGHTYSINDIQDIVWLIATGWYDVVQCWYCTITIYGRRQFYWLELFTTHNSQWISSISYGRFLFVVQWKKVNELPQPVGTDYYTVQYYYNIILWSNLSSIIKVLMFYHIQPTKHKCAHITTQYVVFYFLIKNIFPKLKLHKSIKPMKFMEFKYLEKPIILQFLQVISTNINIIVIKS